MATLYTDGISLQLPEKRSLRKTSPENVERRLPDHAALAWNVVLMPVFRLFKQITLRPILILFSCLAALSLVASWVVNNWTTQPYRSSPVASVAPSHETQELRLLTREH